MIINQSMKQINNKMGAKNINEKIDNVTSSGNLMNIQFQMNYKDRRNKYRRVKKKEEKEEMKLKKY